MTTPQVKPEDNTTPPVSGYDEFSDVFASLMDGGGETSTGDPSTPAVAATSGDPVATGAAESTGTPSATPTPAAAPEATAGTSTTEGEPEAPEETDPAPAADATDWKAKFEALEAERAAAPEPEPPKPVAEAPKPAPLPPIYDDSETTFLKSYEQEWPDVVKGEALKRRAEYREITSHIFAEVARVFGPIAQRAEQTAEAFDDDSMLRAIEHTHSDYDDAMYNSVVSWSKTLNGYERKLAEGIIAEGGPEDVVGLISRYKEAKGIKAAPAPAAPAAPVKATVTELPAAAKKAAKALGVVDSKRGQVTPASSDPNDFDSAWEEAVATAK